MLVTITCPVCWETTDLRIDNEDGYYAWCQGGMLIQDALPELTASEREQLISGICDTCWDETFGED